MAIVEITAPMAASVFEILVSKGDRVEADQELVILESMKMEVPVATEKAGTVAEIAVEPSQAVSEGEVLVRIETD